MSVPRLTPQTSKQFLEENKDSFVVLFFDASWSEAKELTDSTIDALQLSTDIKDKVVIAMVDVEENNSLSTELRVQTVPIAVCMLRGEVTRKINFFEPSQFVQTVREQLRKYSILAGDEPIEDTAKKTNLDDYLKRLIIRSPVMIFMKGNPQAPRCGFSKQLIEILAKNDIKYDSFDILQDEEVRQGLKELSNWPTYPQIYVKGEFVGGLDVLKELQETHQLKETLKV